MNTRLIRRTSSAPIWLACWSDECKGEIREFQIVSMEIGSHPHNTYRCVSCDSQVDKTPAEIQALTGDTLEE